MEDATWLGGRDPAPMLEFLRGRASDRKMRLFAVACCRRIWHLLADEQSRNAVEVAERFAEGIADETELSSATRGMTFSPGTPDAAAYLTSVRRFDRPSILHRYGIVDLAQLDEELRKRIEIICSSERFPAEAALAVARRAGTAAGPTEAPIQAAVLHCLFGPDPARPFAVNPAWSRWNGGLVPVLAKCIYEGRQFSHLPILVDALEEAGCHDADILVHCRGQGLHVRGCFALDLILDKK